MCSLKNNKLVIFGAGKIGRSFIGQLFSRGGYEVVFIDVFKAVIDELNRRGNYDVIIKSDNEAILNIKNVRGVLADQEDAVIEEIAGASILAVSVGQNGLPMIFPLISKGLLKRYELNKNNPLDIILAENLRDAADYFHEKLKTFLPDDYPLDRMVGLVETSIGKMVPLMRRKDMDEDILKVFAEPYNTLILDKKAFKNPIPDIEGLAPKDNMKAWVDRKLFIHNLGHAATAYLGYLYNPGFVYLYEALAIPEIYIAVRDTMLQSADLLLKKYPGEFTLESLTEHVDDLLLRFQNVHLGDTIFRVGCDLFRKLSAQDRLAGAVHLAVELNLPCDKVILALVCGCRFRATDEKGSMFPNDIEFSKIYEKGIRSVLTDVCEFSESTEFQVIGEAEKIDQHLKQQEFPRKIVDLYK